MIILCIMRILINNFIQHKKHTIHFLNTKYIYCDKHEPEVCGYDTNNELFHIYIYIRHSSCAKRSNDLLKVRL